MKLSVSVPLSLLSLAACVRAGFEATCKDIKITGTGVITAHCDDGNGGSNDTSLDLKDCYTYYDEELITIGDGHLPDLCRECSIVMKPGDIWPADVAWVRCYCEGGWREVNTHNEVQNTYGVLECPYARHPVC
ncbi:uncharacterized protein F5Z01DRAFT_109051 [Emericellopsis atlantica]|uniref:Cyanovirin-N domain-containing protein n=1 Tax=Emericellopsis atlantica TaxID=2614577 RepID=A0A9P7ZLW3_9HYPO|nr:uncharacterized protein F5Z01DRAFT_109051 [Emericellopsis atlantica]KAG9254528.1 hypothetical protein F5Z01DRAFT_109051 [Emericellopsis atlantica]